MNATPRRLTVATVFAAVGSVAYAHPGHGGHELTWDLDHLIAHPGATFLCFSVIGVAVWVLIRVTGAAKRERR